MTQQGHNGIDPVVAKRWIGEAMRVYADLDEQKIANMNECRAIRARLPEIYESAKNAGLPVKAFKLVLRKRLKEQKIAGLEADIEALTPEDDEDAETFEQFKAAIGDFGELPLGAAAIERKAGEEDRDLRPPFLRDKDAQRASDEAIGKANGAAVAKGIKGLPGADAAEA